MRTVRVARALGLALLGWLAACEEDAGTPCRQDYHCYSGSCTWGTCDSSLGRELAEALESDEDASSAREEPRCRDLAPAQCTPAHCKLEPACALQPSCREELEVRLGCVACNPFNCEAPCVEVTRCTSR